MEIFFSNIFLKIFFSQNKLLSIVFLKKKLQKYFWRKYFLQKNISNENIFGENIFVNNIFGKNIFFLLLQTTPTSSQLLISDF